MIDKHDNYLRAAEQNQVASDNRYKRFRMLDQDEFQEMLKSLSQQTSDEQEKPTNGIDTIGGMQLASKSTLLILYSILFSHNLPFFSIDYWSPS